jgi:hypothetical protein
MVIPVFLIKDVALFFPSGVNFELSFSFSWVDHLSPDILHNRNRLSLFLSLFLLTPLQACAIILGTGRSDRLAKSLVRPVS